ncbi:hypothetical protein DL1_17605 [Thioclava dalianensis]|uniref:DUF112 domain-containing protein n=1 Tax=Thioclava dalianensis TaxID=1185766 RepID=A0A074TFF5_9RHOB|nr:hypothetical protein DL1_17605 [Thioclava dalianensis]SFN32470.1 Tripartite tricarboxylate transporter TctA family protein [Thioclava dalianensis]
MTIKQSVYSAAALAFLPRGTPDEVVRAYTKAFDAVRNRPDFKQIAKQQVGDCEVFVGEGAKRATKEGTTVSPEAKAYVTNWLSVRCSLIGVVVGVIPGLGGSVVGWIAYGHAVQTTKDKSNFGKG